MDNTRLNDQLRRRILQTLDLARGFAPSGAMGGERLKKESDDDFGGGLEFESESHFLQLCRDLINLGLVEMKEVGRRRKGERFAASHALFAITGKGTLLLEEKIPPVAGVEDGRAPAGE